MDSGELMWQVLSEKLSSKSVKGIVIAFVEEEQEGVLVNIEEFTNDDCDDLHRNFTSALANLFYEAQKQWLERRGETGKPPKGLMKWN